MNDITNITDMIQE